MLAVGHLLGYGAGTIDMLKIFGTTLGDSQFKQLTAISAMSLIFAVCVTSYAVDERVLISSKYVVILIPSNHRELMHDRDADVKTGALKMIRKILRTTTHLPDRIQAICWIQFWAWIGWFPFLFYSTTWVGETYFRYSAAASPSTSSDTLGDVGRVGSLSLVVFSIITFTGSVLFPWLVQSPEHETRNSARSFTPRPPPGLAPLAATIDKYKPDLLTAWMYSHLIFAAAMSLTPLVRSLRMATILVSICGLPWTLACWAPFAFMGIEINRLTTPSRPYRPLSGDLSSPATSPTFLRLHHRDFDRNDPDDSIADSSTGETAGIYLGILNLFTTLPQFVGTFISMIVFSILEPGKSEILHKDIDEAGPDSEAAAAAAERLSKAVGGRDKPNAIAVCLFIGSLSAVGAAYATRRMKMKR
ncbi:hypothetical protein MMC07_007107, partial [Pseudocyphellaria aurata]|nr:hypothetical protein [Pseudocyphellaria aurata]